MFLSIIVTVPIWSAIYLMPPDSNINQRLKVDNLIVQFIKFLGVASLAGQTKGPESHRPLFVLSNTVNLLKE